MVDTVIKHYDHPKRLAISRNLTKFESPTTIHDVRKYIANEDDFPSLFYYVLEIYNRDHKHYFKLDDRYIQLYKPFNCVDIMINGQSTLSGLKRIKLRVTWMKINNNDEKRIIRENTSQEASDEQSTSGLLQVPPTKEITSYQNATQSSSILSAMEQSNQCKQNCVTTPSLSFFYCIFHSGFGKHNDSQSMIIEEASDTDFSIQESNTPTESETNLVPSSLDLFEDTPECRPTSEDLAALNEVAETIHTTFTEHIDFYESNQSNVEPSNGPSPEMQSLWNETTLISIQCGLKNMGNTCYMNVILQMLANITVLKDWIFRNNHRTTCQQSEICALCWLEETLKGMYQKCQSESKPVYEPKLFYDNLKLLSPQFKKNTQQDCSEFLLSLFEHTEESSILSEIFQFQSQRVTQCEKCKTSKPGPIENNTIMQCSIPQPIVCSLEDCLNSYCEKELLVGDNKYQCDTCKSKQNGDTKMEICSTPQVLLIALKRFQANGPGKLDYAVTYEEVLHLDNWLSKDYSAKITESHKIYHLCAVIIHRGEDMESGHYICYVKNEITNEWYEANDESIKKVEFVFDKNKEVYLLCYVRSDLNKSIITDNTQATGISDKSIGNQDQWIPNEELLNELRNKTKFYFLEDVHIEQRRYGKCDVFGKLESKQSQALHCSRLWLKGELHTAKETSYPKLTLVIPSEFRQCDWKIKVHSITECNEYNGVHYLQSEKKFLEDLKDRAAPLVNPIEVKITDDDFSKKIHT
ncbi:unnamed protein product [Adineta steineri]|uniref:Ubiquitin carboxyl-terminal hydrolase n=1 Tax=Adineta steineri TaxID=433720 RepID=A0A819VPZ8_9BILA|nr:unnamed protein product [Adineta steineri]CAF4111265.1 unnamed protein product [Adineta steineri]